MKSRVILLSLCLALPTAALAQTIRVARPPIATVPAAPQTPQAVPQAESQATPPTTADSAPAAATGGTPVRAVGKPSGAAGVDRATFAVDEAQWTRDRILSLRKEMLGLKGRVSTLEAELRKQMEINSFTCTSSSVSTSGRGASEYCDPFACNYLDGRCRNQCDTSDQCAPGYLCDTGRRVCVAPPPSKQDEEDDWPFW
jgi:hypothetical protein